MQQIIIYHTSTEHMCHFDLSEKAWVWTLTVQMIDVVGVFCMHKFRNFTVRLAKHFLVDVYF